MGGETSGGSEQQATPVRSTSRARGYSKPVLDKEKHRHARKAALENYICKLTVLKTDAEVDAAEAKGDAVTDFGGGVKMRLDRWPMVPKRGERYGDYGVPVAVSLLLRICVEGIVLFVVMFLFAQASIQDNTARSADRRTCRYAAGTDEGYAVLTNRTEYFADTASFNAASAQVEAEMGFPPMECGWSGLHIRRFNRTTLDVDYQPTSDIYLLRTALGGCMEYRGCESGPVACSEDTLPRGPIAERPSLLARTPTARYCLGAAQTSYTASILRLVNLLLVLAFLIRVRYLSQAFARDEDESRITTADFSLSIDGLDTSLPPNELRRKLRAEIEALPYEGKEGHFAGAIHHMDVGRNCRAEILVTDALHRLDLRVTELSERKAAKAAVAASTSAEDRALTALVPQFTSLRAQLNKLVDEDDVATGHAFIAFNYEVTRNQFYTLFNPPPRAPDAPRGSSYDSVEGGGAPAAASKPARAPILEVASAESKAAAAEYNAREHGGADDQMRDTIRYILGVKKVDKRMVVSSAPETRELDWKALELSDEHEGAVVLKGRAATWTLIIIGLVSLLAAKIFQFVFRLESPAFLDPTTSRNIGYVITLGVTAVTMTFNLLIRKMTALFVEWEGKDTHTEAENSAFQKLSLGLGANTVIVPLLIAFLCAPPRSLRACRPFALSLSLSHVS